MVWAERTRRVASFISTDQTVMDLGCGQMTLRDAIPKGCRYIPADLVKRSDDCRQIELNEGLWPQETADVVVALGVLEYVYDIKGFFYGCARIAPRLIFSYHISYSRNYATRVERMKMGWLNDFPISQVVTEIVRAGGKIERIDGFMHKQNFTQYLFVVVFPI